MNYIELDKELNSLAYHGRGIIIGKSPDGRKAVTAYFLMGRSENSPVHHEGENQTQPQPRFR